MTATAPPARPRSTLQGRFAGVRTWTAETPNRYRLAVELADRPGAFATPCRENFGFRTIEVRAGDGIYVNGGEGPLRGTQPTRVLAGVRARAQPAALAARTSSCSRA